MASHKDRCSRYVNTIGDASHLLGLSKGAEGLLPRGRSPSYLKRSINRIGDETAAINQRQAPRSSYRGAVVLTANCLLIIDIRTYLITIQSSIARRYNK